jgi:hypothetical protein
LCEGVHWKHNKWVHKKEVLRQKINYKPINFEIEKSYTFLHAEVSLVSINTPFGDYAFQQVEDTGLLLSVQVCRERLLDRVGCHLVLEDELAKYSACEDYSEYLAVKSVEKSAMAWQKRPEVFNSVRTLDP